MADANDTSERWLPIPGYEAKYEVSDHGRVRSKGRWITRRHTSKFWTEGQELKPRLGHYGHHYVTLFGKTKKDRKHCGVHQLVLLAFVGTCPEEMECCHWDDVPANNHLSNLRWGTKSDNMQDKVRNGNHHNANKTHCKNGHPYTVENTYRSPADPNKRACKACKRARRKVLTHPDVDFMEYANAQFERIMRGDPPIIQTHCKRGHEFTEENTYRSPNRPGRVCRKCKSKADFDRW